MVSPCSTGLFQRPINIVLPKANDTKCGIYKGVETTLTASRSRAAAQKLIDETFAGASPQVYFERYRTYLLALAPAIAQQLLEVVGK